MGAADSVAVGDTDLDDGPDVVVDSLAAGDCDAKLDKLLDRVVDALGDALVDAVVGPLTDGVLEVEPLLLAVAGGEPLVVIVHEEDDVFVALAVNVELGDSDLLLVCVIDAVTVGDMELLLDAMRELLLDAVAELLPDAVTELLPSAEEELLLDDDKLLDRVFAPLGVVLADCVAG